MATTVFQHNDYRKAFDAIFVSEKKLRPGWSVSALAEKVRLQPSYISNVLKERAHFSSDQIHALGHAVELNETEIRYLDLLMLYERAEFPQRKKQLRKQLDEIKNREVRAKAQLTAKENQLKDQELERYYLDPNIELIHLYLGIRNAPTDTREIARIWGFTSDYVAEILQFLKRTGLAELAGKKWVIRNEHKLLAHDSALSKPHQILKRMRALEAIQRKKSQSVYSVTGTITIDEETRAKIQAKFVAFLKDVEKLSVQSQPEGIYHLQFDLFPWIDSDPP